MRKKTNFYKLFILLLISNFIFTTGCQQQQEKPPPIVDPAFTGYISAFTTGIISNESTIRIKLMEDIFDVKYDDPIDEDLFSFSPKIKGEAYFIDKRTIEFRPEERLSSGKVFEGKFHLGKLVDVPDKLQTLEFQFRTKQQAVSVNFKGISAYDNSNMDWQKLTGTLQTADNANDEDIETLLTAVQNGKKLKITWEHGSGLLHNFCVDSITRKESKGEVILEWSGDDIGAKDNDNENIIEIPPLGDFKVVNVNVTHQPEQYITVYFSDPIKPDQEFEGLVHLKNGQNVRLIVDGNSIKAYPTKRLIASTSIIIENSIRNVMNYQMDNRYDHQVVFSNIKPAVQMIGTGVILPNSNGLIFPFKAVNLSAVNVKIIKIFEENVAQFLQRNQFDGKNEMKRVGRIVYWKEVLLTSDKVIDYGQWNTFSLDLAELIQSEPGAIYRVIIGFERSQSLYNCPNDDTELNVTGSSIDKEKEESSYDGSGSNYYYDNYYYNYYNHNYNDRKNPCKEAYYKYNNRYIARNILASDLGLIAKGGSDNSILVAVTDLVTTDYLSNVTIEIYNYQNQLMSTGTTDSKGFVTIDLEKKPFLLVAKKGSQRGYLRLDDGSALSLSMFDVGGQKNSKGVKGIIYGDRGVWRPGDSIFVSFVLEDKNSSIPANHPVVFELYTPENQLSQKTVKTYSVNGFYDFRTATKPDSPTGNWMAKVRVGGSTFTKTLKIEAVKPNRLKINLDFNTDVLKKGDNPEGILEIKWLHGAIAKNLKADVEMKLEKGRTAFKEYPGYKFDDPVKTFRSDNKKIFDSKVDENGKATVYTNIRVGDNAPGMLKARFKIRAFEKGGDFSIDQFSIPYSPYESYAGVKFPKGSGWNGAIYTNEPNLIPIVTVDEDGKPVDREKVKIEVFEIRWRWWWERSSNDDLSRYVRNTSRYKILTDYVSTIDGKAMYELNFSKNTWGRKLIRVTDPVSGHITGQLFYTSYKGWWNNAGSDNPGGAEMLTFSTDKNKYDVGEEVELTLPKSQSGKALVSIESGSKIIDAFWIEVSKRKNKFSFITNADMSPNVYIHISYIQPHNHAENDLPIRLYGVQAIQVEDPKTHLKPVISMPDVLAPEEEVSITISETNSEKMTYTIAVVDEGLLDLTRFRTPDLWKHFYAREALGVKTWDLYKYVIGAFTGEMSGLLALGGGDEVKKDEKKSVNRFKPVVKFLGPFELKPGEKTTHTFTMPNYIGSVRTMVVAGQDGAYGSVEKTTPVKKPLMVLATLPRVIGPTETVKLPVTVFAMEDNIKNVKVEVITNDLFKIKGDKVKTLKFEKVGDMNIDFDLEVIERIGAGNVKVIVSSGKARAEYNIDIEVRLPNPRMTHIIDGMISPGESWESDYSPVGLEGTNNGIVEISSIPPLNLSDRLKYLIRYPHGCIEQTTSSVFPQLHLSTLLDLDNIQKSRIQDNVIAGIDRLRGFQTTSGGFSYWPGEYEASWWGTNYAGHFILEAKALGYTLPPGLLNGWIKYQKDMANNWDRNSTEYRHYYQSSQLIQAYRLFTLALAGKPAIGAMNRMREIKDLSTVSRWRLASAYYLAGREGVAADLVKDLETTVKEYKELSYSYGSTQRDLSMIFESLVLMNQGIKAKYLFDDISKNLSSGRWYSTQTTAYSLLAIAKFVGTNDTSVPIEYNININGDIVDVKSESPVTQRDLNIKKAENGKIIIKNNSEKRLYVKVQLDGIPLIGDKTSENNNLNMTVTYKDLAGNKIDPSNLNQGTDFMAEVVVHHPGSRSNYKEMALTQIFASGWEIRNLRMEEATSNLVADKPRYEDIRDDRVYSYFDIYRNQSLTYRVILNAAYVGKYYLPTVYCEAMYDNEINSSVSGRWVNVVKPGGAINQP